MTYDELKIAYENSQIEIQNLKLQINSLTKMLYGPKREKTPETVIEGQCSLFETDEEVEKDAQEQIVENVEEIIVHRKKNAKKKIAGIKKSALKDVIVKREEYTINEGENCPKCNGKLKLVKKNLVRQEIDYTPATFVIKEIFENVYKCEKCGTKDSEEEGSTFIKTETPRGILPHSFASASLATEVIYNKYYLGVPLYRQEKMWDDKGLVLPRNMMANWCIKINEYYLEAIWKLMLKEMKAENKLIHRR